MRSFLNDHLTISMYALVIAVAATASAWYVDSREERITADLHAAVDTQVAVLHELAVVADGNGADPRTSAVVRDCPRRTEFETLLGNLDGATRLELITTQQLFESCGSYYAERKALTVREMEREYEVLTTYVNILRTLEDIPEEITRALEFSKLIELEHDRSSLLNEQVVIQERIIASLIAGEDRSIVVFPSITEAAEVAETLTVLDRQIDEMRKAISP